MKREDLEKYLQNQIVQSPLRLEGYTKDLNGRPLLKRDVYSLLEGYAREFLGSGAGPQIIVMPGLRGVGKTTLLAQLFLELPKDTLKLYLSVDELVKRFDANLWDAIETYEWLIERRIETLDRPLFLFLDEVHYETKWATFLKSMFDRSKKVFIFCTGSAALLLRDEASGDLARRAFFTDIHPMSFKEYLMLKNKKVIKGNLSSVESILQADNADNLFEKLKADEKAVREYWLDVDKLEIVNYLKFGTLPFTLSLANKEVAFDYIGQIINKVVYSDIPQFCKFDIETLNKIEKILYLLSDSLAVSITSLSELLGTKKDTLSLVLNALEKAGVLIRVAPYGAHHKQVRKPSKYLFASPSLRFFFLNSRESTRIFDIYKGSLFEDAAGMYLMAFLPKYGSFSLTYDVTEGGADFIVRSVDRKIVIEVGLGDKGLKQAQTTLARIDGNYGLVISDSGLSYHDRFIKLPLEHFLLML